MDFYIYIAFGRNFVTHSNVSLQQLTEIAILMSEKRNLSKKKKNQTQIRNRNSPIVVKYTTNVNSRAKQ